jgi:hypothetical protein
MTDEIDTTNKFLVGVQGDCIVFLRPVPRSIPKEDALLLAAYIVALVGDGIGWDVLLSAVQNA